MSVCTLCPRQCGVNRKTAFGYCHMPETPVVARAALHFYEEPPISGTRGSGAIFFSGCSLRCVYCQNYEISQKYAGVSISVERLAELFRELEAQGAHNINLVNPTHFTYAILQALDCYRPAIPIVWNSGGYERVETLRDLEGYVDIYLPDLKYIDAAVSREYSDARNYFSYAGPALLEMQRQIGEEKLDASGILQRGMIVRHLLLPQGTRQAILVARWVQEQLPLARFSLMAQYLPLGRAGEHPRINRKITRREYKKVLDALAELGMERVFVQDRSSAETEYIPAFDGTGV